MKYIYAAFATSLLLIAFTLRTLAAFSDAKGMAGLSAGEGGVPAHRSGQFSPPVQAVTPTGPITQPTGALTPPIGTLALTGTVMATDTPEPEASLTPTTTATITEGIPTITSTPLPPIINVRPRDVARTLASRLLMSAIILVGAWGVAFVTRHFTYKLLSHIHLGVRTFVARLVYFAVWIGALLWVLRVFQLEIATMTAIIGSIGLALSLSSQDLFKNFIAGIYILMERPFSVGDRITVGAFTGRVEYVDLRITKLRTVEKEEVIIPNTIVLSQVVVKKPPPE